MSKFIGDREVVSQTCYVTVGGGPEVIVIDR